MEKIVIENLTLSYGKFIAFKNLNVKVESGEILGLLGPNGSGKTTKIKVILGFVPYVVKVLVNAEK